MRCMLSLTTPVFGLKLYVEVSVHTTHARVRIADWFREALSKSTQAELLIHSEYIACNTCTTPHCNCTQLQ